MNYTDIVPLTYATKTATYNTVIRVTANGYPGTGTISESLANVYDANTATYYQYYLHHTGDGNTCGEFYVDATWDKACTIYSAYVYGSYSATCGNYPSKEIKCITYLKISGTWTAIDTLDTTTIAAGFTTYEKTISTGWNDVTGIRFYMYGFAYSYEGDRNQNVYLRIHEMRVYREKNEEILRIKKTGSSETIGSNTLTSSHKLRIRKGATTYGVPLLDTDDPMASTIRIYNGSTVKALAKAD